jgi:hypothetical protein
MRLIFPKLLKTHIEKMADFRLSKIFMKTNELNSALQDVDENKGEVIWAVEYVACRRTSGKNPKGRKDASPAFLAFQLPWLL